MPISSSEGKQWTVDRIRALGPVSVLDVGAGAGTYARLLADVPTTGLTAIEVFAPYLETYRLRELYDEVILGDARTLALPAADVVILGDVLEHMERDEAVALWARAGVAARRAVYLSLPIVHYPQGALEHNEHEVHVVDDWDHEKVLAAFPGIGSHWTGSVVGVYERLGPAGP